MAELKTDFSKELAGLVDQPLIDALVDDVLSLAYLHNQELTAETITQLQALSFPFNLGIAPQEEQQPVWQSMQDALDRLDTQPATLDKLAAEYAAIYLTGAYQASPYESVWTDDEHLMCQRSMFELRELYRQAGFRVENWRMRPDDHLVFELYYLAHYLGKISDLASIGAIRDFLDQHLMLWYPEFVRTIAKRSDNDFYVSLNLLTCSWCDALQKRVRAIQIS